MTEFLRQLDFPLGSGNIIRKQQREGKDLYIITLLKNTTYKLFIINDKNPEGKKLIESDSLGKVENKLQSFWD